MNYFNKTEMKKNIFILIILLVTFNSFSQNIIGKKSTEKPIYSENSEIKVFYNKFQSNEYSAGVFVNGIFAGEQSVLSTFNSDKIESLNIEKVNFEKDEKKYYGKILVKMKNDYIPKFVTLKAFIEKHMELDKSPIVFQIDENIISQDYKEYLVDENFILKIIQTKIKTTERETEINLIKLITRTPENIKKANQIIIRGKEI